MGEDHYRTAGVDTEKAAASARWLQEQISTTGHSAGEVLAGVGGFAAVYQPKFKDYTDPVLVSCTDGVGTKLALGKKFHQLENIGIDLVAMCVNDLYTTGAEPLFFLDYFGCDKLSATDFKSVLTGILQGLKQANCQLIGGETAELPGFYRQGNFDLVGFVVGIVAKKKLLSNRVAQVGDRLLALPSSGFHSNGFSLLRQRLAENEQTHFSKRLLTPTRIYQQVPQLAQKNSGLRGVAHITGGGIAHNLSRILPANTGARIDVDHVLTPDWMLEIASRCGLKDFVAAQQVFNMGVGMIAIVAPDGKEDFIVDSKRLDLNVTDIGEILESSSQEVMFR